MFFAFGFVLVPTTALMSPKLDELLKYPADTAGYMAIPRNIALGSISASERSAPYPRYKEVPIGSRRPRPLERHRPGRVRPLDISKKAGIEQSSSRPGC
jgi:hypothetical protein